MNDSDSMAHAQSPLLELAHASVQREGRLILKDVSLAIAAGEHTAILGPNGSGKSSLVKLITRQFYPLARADRWSVRVFGRERWHLDQLQPLLGIVSPGLQTDYTSETPLETYDAVISSFFSSRGLSLDQTPTPAMHDAARAAIERVGARALIGRQLSSLSTGEARRILIARALVHRPRALLLDEPCTGLDMASRRNLLEMLRQLAKEGTTLILVTHHIEEILPEIRQVALLREGQLLGHGDKRDYLTPARLSAMFETPVSVEQRGDWYWAALEQPAS